jgi:phosphoribosylformimino-5-aminoimidazole carboxamide ribotide isomerase
MDIIPAIDIIGGKCVRLTQGDFSQTTVYNQQPVEVAKQFEDAGLKRLHLVDLEGAKAGAVKNWKVLEVIASKTGLIIDFGGGVKTEKDVSIVLNSGASFVSVGSIAVTDEVEFLAWVEKYGPQKFLLGADVKDEKIMINGWTSETDILIHDFIENYQKKGITQIFCTDVSRDGLLQGPSTALYKTIIEKFPDLFFITSGGVSSMDDIYKLQEVGCKAVIIGKAIYEQRIKLSELEEYITTC